MANSIYTEDPFHFAPLWDAILSIYQEFATICNQYDLRHYAIGGTLLGAVRHHGFIPWDDDLDIAMPRPDFEKFKSIAKDVLPKGLKLVDRRNTPEFKALYFKIQCSDAALVMGLEKTLGRELKHGVYIDVFPIDGYVDTYFRRVLGRVNELFARIGMRYYFRKDYPTSWVDKIKTVVAFLTSVLKDGFLLSRDKFMQARERYFRRWGFDDVPCSGTCGCHIDRFQMTFPEGLWSNTVMLPFGCIQMPAPGNYKKFLEINYGDYMTLPPEEKRLPTHGELFSAPWKLGPTKKDQY